MKLLFGRRAAALMATTIVSLGIVAASAQAATASSSHPSATAPATVVQATVGPDFTCPSRSVCIFQDNDWSGLVEAFPTVNDSEQWINLVRPFGVPSGLTLPWHSFNNNSGSSVVFGDAQTGQETCYLPHARISGLGSSVGNDRYMWIEFGNTTCSGVVGPLP
jgi:hypothetical protein